MLSKLDIEDMSHLGASFNVPDTLHHSQQQSNKIKVKLFFMVGVSDEEHEACPEVALKLVSIRIPTGIPIYRVRGFISHMESELQKIYGQAKRTNFVFTAPEGSNFWSHDFQLPLYGVYYI
jgi:hypothetical protein